MRFLRQYQLKLVDVFYDASRALAAADAESSQAVFAADFFQAVEQCNEDTSAGSSDRMAESDSAAVDVDFAHVEAEFTNDVYGLCCESFVSFNEGEIVSCEAGFFQGFAGRRNRSDTHDGRINACGSVAYNFSHRFEAEFSSFFSGHDYECSCAVVDAGSVASRYGAAFFEGRF